MTTTVAATQNASNKRVLWLQYVTLAWMLLECSVALTAAWKARSVALLAFGSDSLVELISASVVLLQFAPAWRVSQARAAKICGALLYVVAAAVLLIASAGLLFKLQSETSRTGIAITAGALVLMPVLAHLKRKAAAESGNKALRADAVQSATCAYLAAITLAGLLLRMLGLRWIDQVAALAAIPILIIEARRARKGIVCTSC